VVQLNLHAVLSDLLAGVSRGQTVLRSLEDAALLRRVALHGRCVDLGGGDSGYLDRFRRDGPIFPIVIDILAEARPTVRADFERGLPLQSSCADTVLLHNVLEHVHDYRGLVAEIRRILAPRGRLYFSTPFFVPLHERAGAYRDYHRFSAPALERIFADFADLQIAPIQVGPFLSGCHAAFSAIPTRPVRIAAVAAASALDAFYARVRRRRDPSTRIEFVLAYVGIATA
jgi:SAM-dependent methyltransferase